VRMERGEGREEEGKGARERYSGFLGYSGTAPLACLTNGTVPVACPPKWQCPACASPVPAGSALPKLVPLRLRSGNPTTSTTAGTSIAAAPPQGAQLLHGTESRAQQGGWKMVPKQLLIPAQQGSV